MAKYQVTTLFPHIRPVGIIISNSLQMRVLLENTIFSLHKIIRNGGLLELRVLFVGGPYMRKYDIFPLKTMREKLTKLFIKINGGNINVKKL